jgi:predicted GIY-YIG superfamily endonuclease
MLHPSGRGDYSHASSARLGFPPASCTFPWAPPLHHTFAMEKPRRIVYVLKNGAEPPRYYTGLTSHFPTRLDAHNAGRVPHTSNGKPWHADVVIEFADEHRAIAFEKYLKSGSGCAFAKRHLRCAGNRRREYGTCVPLENSAHDRHARSESGF